MSDIFKQKEYNPDYYNEVVANYTKGKQYNIQQWHWGYDDNKTCIKIIDKTTICSTINDFNREIWDLFAQFAEKNTYHIIWGAFGLESRNPEKPTNQYFDGLIFYLVKKEFEECIKNQYVSRFMSCLIHYGYYNLDFVVVD